MHSRTTFRWTLTIVAALVGCDLQRKPITGSDNPVVEVVVRPDTLTLDPLQSHQFAVFGRTDAGDSVPVSVRWTASVGTVSQSGTYTADTSAADATVTATLASSSVSGSSRVRKNRVVRIVVNPKNATVVQGAVQQFLAYGVKNTGDSVNVAVAYTATGGTISQSGTYTAGAVSGTYRVIAAQNNGSLADTSSVTVSIVPVASVAVSPAAASVAVGATVQLAATPRDSAGNPLSGRVVAWSSSAPAVATVSAAGLVSGVAAGSATVTATIEGRSGAAGITVTAAPPPPPPPPTAPGTVSDLRVTGATDSSLTLAFTEVSDGAGQPASYDVRWAAGALDWASATEVARGSCRTPMAGSSVGATRSCTILGLAGSTGYQLQLVAFRGTLNVDAVFGGLSNVASGTTSASTAPVASVTVNPATAGVLVGATQQFTATLRDASGNVLTGRAISWASSNLSIATVTVGGLASGLVAGTATITATSEGKSGTATLTVSVTPPPPPPGSWPNEPAGFTLLTDEPFNALVENGWHQVQRQTTNGSGLFLRTDLTAPLSLSSVLEFKYAAGYTGGSEPGVEYYNPSSPVKETYFSFWWKPSNPWQNHPGSSVNKLAFLFPSSGGPIYIMMFGEGGSYFMNVEPEFSGDVRRLPPNVTATPVALGVWHRVEWYVKYSTTGSSRDGVTRWWLDGVLQGDYRDLQTPGDAGFSEYQLAPTWGGIGGTKTETDYYWFDHARISRR